MLLEIPSDNFAIDSAVSLYHFGGGGGGGVRCQVCRVYNYTGLKVSDSITYQYDSSNSFAEVKLIQFASLI